MDMHSTCSVFAVLSWFSKKEFKLNGNCFVKEACFTFLKTPLFGNSTETLLKQYSEPGYHCVFNYEDQNILSNKFN